MGKSRSEDFGRRRSLSDPLAAALLPPPNESPEDKELRLRAENDAKKVSDLVNEYLYLLLISSRILTRSAMESTK